MSDWVITELQNGAEGYHLSPGWEAVKGTRAIRALEVNFTSGVVGVVCGQVKVACR
jgi:hypothetical protein